MTDFARVGDIARDDVAALERAQRDYGDSWKRRGGVGAFMMLARKMDRLENQVVKYAYNVFEAIKADTRPEGIIDDIRDLRRYLLLVEAEMTARGVFGAPSLDAASAAEARRQAEAHGGNAAQPSVPGRVPPVGFLGASGRQRPSDPRFGIQDVAPNSFYAAEERRHIVDKIREELGLPALSQQQVGVNPDNTPVTAPTAAPAFTDQICFGSPPDARTGERRSLGMEHPYGYDGD